MENIRKYYHASANLCSEQHPVMRTIALTTECPTWPGEVMDPRAARWGQSEMFPELEDFAGARHQGRSRDRPWLHLSP